MKKLINFRPILFIAISLISGILCAYFQTLQNFVAFFVLTLVNLSTYVIFICLYSKKGKLKRNLISCACFIIAFVLGFSLFKMEINNYTINDLGGHYYTINGSIEEINNTDYGSAVILNQINLKGVNGGDKRYKISLTIYGESNLKIGDKITFSSHLIDKSIFYENRFCAEAVSEKVKWQAECNIGDIQVLGNEQTIFQKCNLFIKDSLSCGLEEEEFGVALAMLLGNSDYFANYLLYNYRNLGTAHIFAISGLHMGFICAFLTLIFKFIKTNKFLKFIIITLSLFFYSGICGFTSSSLRASIMCATALLGSALGERYDGVTAISLSATLILLIKPSQLFCISFILSFMAVIGILLLSKPIAKIFKFFPKKLADSLGVVASAWLSTFPILIDYFSKVSIISMIANLIIIPFISFIFIFLLMGAVLGGIFQISFILFFPSNYVLKGLNFIVSAMDYGIFNLVLTSFGFISLLYYGALVVASGFINVKSALKRIISVACMLVFILLSVFVNVSAHNKTTYYFVGGENISATLIHNSEERCLVISGAKLNFSQSKLTRIFNASKTDKLTSVIILNDGSEKDVQLFTTRLNHLIEIERIIYPSNLSVVGIDAFKKSFPNIQLITYNDNENIIFSDVKMSFDLNGYCAKIDNFLLIFSQFGSEYENFGKLSENFDNVIAGERIQNIISQFNGANVISYRSSSIVRSAEREGYIKIEA